MNVVSLLTPSALSAVAGAPARRHVRVRSIIARAAEIYDLRPEDITSPARVKHVTRCRKLVVWTVRTLRKDLSYPQIGAQLGRRDHSTIIHNWHAAEALRAVDPEFADDCDVMIAAFKGGETWPY